VSQGLDHRSDGDTNERGGHGAGGVGVITPSEVTVSAKRPAPRTPRTHVNGAATHKIAHVPVATECDPFAPVPKVCGARFP
jgi:hypothetical protein